MRTRFSLPMLIAAACGVVHFSALADTITLKSGEKIEGKVTEETPTEIVVEYKVSAAITDERRLKRTDVLSVEKESPEVAAWNSIKALAPGASSMAASQYDEVLKVLNFFVTSYPESTHIEEVKKTIAAFEADKKRVDAGEVKLAGNWLTKEQVDKERYQISAMLAYNNMTAQAARGDIVGALNTFVAIEKNYPGAKSLPDAAEYALRLMPTLKSTIDRAIQTLQNEATGRSQAGGVNRQQLEAAAAKDDATGAAQMAASEKAGLKWPPLAARSGKVLGKLLELIKSESARISALPVAKMRESFQLTDQAQKQIAAGDFQGADASVKKAGTLHSANEFLKRLTAEINEGKKSEMAAAAAAKAADEEQAKAAEEAAKAAAAVKPKPKPVVVAAATPAPVEEKSFFLTIPGGITVVVLLAVILGGLNLFMKMKKRNSGEIES